MKIVCYLAENGYNSGLCITDAPQFQYRFNQVKPKVGISVDYTDFEIKAGKPAAVTVTLVNNTDKCKSGYFSVVDTELVNASYDAKEVTLSPNEPYVISVGADGTRHEGNQRHQYPHRKIAVER